MPPPQRPEFAEFVADIEPSLRRALAEEFGPAAGREATVDALAFAWANWDRVATSDDATAYLLKVGQTAAERHRPLATGDVTPLLPRSQSAFDALVPPIGADAAMDRAAELVNGAPTTMLSRPEAPTTVVATIPAAAAAARYADGPATMRLPPVPPGSPAGPPMRRTIPWVVAAVLVGVIALGGIALANRSGDGSGGTDTSLLPTLPTAVTISTVASSAPASAPPAETSVPLSDPVVDTLPPDDTVTTPATRPPSSAAATPPATNPPATDPPATNPPATNPPSSAATTPPSTPPPSTAPPESTVPPRPTVPDNVGGSAQVSPRTPGDASRSRR